MAGRGAVQDLCNEVTCPICLDYFTDPVTIVECGHNFCQACLTKNWVKGCRKSTCPQCRGTVRRRNFIPNRQLKNVVEIAKKLRGQKDREAEGVCEKHQEPLKLFCKDHEALICVVCDRSKEHESHKVVPQEEAFQEYKDRIRNRLKVLRGERKKILTYKADAEKESQDLLNQTEEERQKTKDVFQQMHQFLEEREKILLAQIEEVEKEIQRRRDEHLARLCRELSSLENVIQEMEEKCQETAGLFLQDIRKTLQRSEEKEAFGNPVAFPPELTCRIRGFRDVKLLLEGVIKQFTSKANVTLDPDTANPRLILSEDCRSVRWTWEPQALPDNPERFDKYPFVLGREGFSSGRHFWEVNVESDGSWEVGVARMSVRRKGSFHAGPEEGIWGVRNHRGRYYTYHSPADHPLTQSQKSRRIRVTLDCDEGQVAFLDAETGVCIYTYSGVSFNGETLLPFFSLFGAAPLILFP